MYWFHCPLHFVINPENLCAAITNNQILITFDSETSLRCCLGTKLYTINLISDQYFANLNICSISMPEKKAENIHEANDSELLTIVDAFYSQEIKPIMPRVDDELEFIKIRFSDNNLVQLVDEARVHHERVKDLIRKRDFETASFHKKARDNLRRRINSICIEREIKGS